MHKINLEEDRIGLRFGVTQENRLVLLAVTEGKSSQRTAAAQETAPAQESAPQAAATQAQETSFAREDGGAYTPSMHFHVAMDKE